MADRNFPTQRRIGSVSPNMFEPLALSPDSVAPSPMLISSRNSESGEIPIESDDGNSVPGSGGSSRRTTMSFNDIGMDLIAKVKYPELYKQIIAHRLPPPTQDSQDMDVTIASLQENLVEMTNSREALFSEAITMFERARKIEIENRDLRKNYESVAQANKSMKEGYFKMYLKTEQEEEYISNVLLKRIQCLKQEKETLAQRYEQEEECMTNELIKKIEILQKERDAFEEKVKETASSKSVVDNLMKSIHHMENERVFSREIITRMRREKIDQENALEQEQELLFNTLGRKLEQLNNDKRKMQASLEKAYNSGYVDPAADLADDLRGNASEHLIFEVAKAADQRQKSHVRKLENLVSEMRNKDKQKSEEIKALQAELVSCNNKLQSLSSAREQLMGEMQSVLMRYNDAMQGMDTNPLPNLQTFGMSLRDDSAWPAAPSSQPSPRSANYGEGPSPRSFHNSH